MKASVVRDPFEGPQQPSSPPVRRRGRPNRRGNVHFWSNRRIGDGSYANAKSTQQQQQRLGRVELRPTGRHSSLSSQRIRRDPIERRYGIKFRWMDRHALKCGVKPTVEKIESADRGNGRPRQKCGVDASTNDVADARTWSLDMDCP
jgi:hypothetical protein